MPAIGIYLTAFWLYLMVATAVWIASGLLVLHSRTRPFAGPLAAGMAGSFPGVFLAHLVTGPPILVMVLLGMVLSGLRQDDGNIAIGCALTGMAIFAAASLVGFCTGWRIAWKWASGRSLLEAVASDPWFGAGVRWLLRRARAAVMKVAGILR